MSVGVEEKHPADVRGTWGYDAQATALRAEQLQESVRMLSTQGGNHMSNVVQETATLREALEEAHSDRDRLVSHLTVLEGCRRCIY
jgi:hypothetical protein